MMFGSGFLLVLLLLAGCGRIQTQPAGPALQEPALTAEAAIMADGYRLPLHYWETDGQPRAIVLGLHGFGDYGNSFAPLQEVLVKPGLAAVYAYDQRGFGATERRGIWAGTETLVADLHAVVRLLREHHPDTPLLLVAESMGGAVALVALNTDPPLDVDGAVLLAPAVWGSEAMPWYQRAALSLMLRVAPGATFSGDDVADLGIRPTDDPDVIRALSADPLVQKAARVDTLHGVTTLMGEALNRAPAPKVPTLLLYGTRDQIIPPGPFCDWLQRWSGDAQEGLRAVLYPDGYHMLTRYRQASRTLADLETWLLAPDAAMPSGEEVTLDEAREAVCGLPRKGLREPRIRRRVAAHSVRQSPKKNPVLSDRA